MSNEQLAREDVPPGEAAYINDLTERLRTKIIKDNPPRIMRRDAHPKMHGVVKAEFIVEPGLPQELRVGIFGQPLAYQAFFGGQFKQNGLQVKWLAPTDLFIELGAETGNGDSFPATRRNRNGFNGATLFAHVGGDVGDATSWRAGAAYLDQRADDRSFETVDDFGLPLIDSFTGKSQTWVVDAVLKWTPLGDPNRRQVKVQGEYMRRRETGELAFDTEGSNLSDGSRSTQSGWYLQGVYQFLPRWRAGLRYDALDSGTPSIALVDSGELPLSAFPALLPADPDRISIMLDWNPSEFSRLRAQYDWDDARGEDDRDRAFRLQYIYGIGAHGAHKY